MTEEHFAILVDQTLNQIRETLVVKGKEYRREGNPFHNFDQGAKLSGQLRERVLDGFVLKHEISVADMIDDLELDKLPSLNAVDEKFGDIIIYALIKKISLIDRIETRDNLEL